MILGVVTPTSTRLVACRTYLRCAAVINALNWQFLCERVEIFTPHPTRPKVAVINRKYVPGVPASPLAKWGYWFLWVMHEFAGIYMRTTWPGFLWRTTSAIPLANQKIFREPNEMNMARPQMNIIFLIHETIYFIIHKHYSSAIIFPHKRWEYKNYLYCSQIIWNNFVNF